MNLSALRLAACAAACCLTSAATLAQQVHPADTPAWVEKPIAAPTDWQVQRAVEFRVDNLTSLRYAIDPATISIGEDGVVRYVFIATSTSGAVNAMYEGVRCQTAEVKVYARWDPDGKQWRESASDGKWQALDTRGATRRALQMAHAGVCDNKAPGRSPRHIVDTLSKGRGDLQFR